MKKLLISFLIIIIGVGALAFVLKSNIGLMRTRAQNMIKITSPDFKEGDLIPDKFTCNGSNTSPALNISDIPAGAKSLAITLDDPDAPSGNFNHWIVWNIDPSAQNINEGIIPPGAVSGMNNAGKTGYFGPCPPGSATHHYIFHLYALDTKLNLPETAARTDLLKAMENHIIGEGELMGIYMK